MAFCEELEEPRRNLAVKSNAENIRTNSIQPYQANEDKVGQGENDREHKFVYVEDKPRRKILNGGLNIVSKYMKKNFFDSEGTPVVYRLAER